MSQADPLLDAALDWMVRLQSGDFTEGEQQALDRWRAQSPRHEQLFEQLLASLAPLQRSPWRGHSSTRVLQALERPSSRRRFLGQGLALFAVVASASLLWRWQRGDLAWPGELVTGTAQRREWQLDDGSLLRLNARSRVRPVFEAQRRALELRRGALILQVASDQRRGEFLLECASGLVGCAVGRILLSEEGEATRLVTLEGSASLQLRSGIAQQVAPRRSVLFDRTTLLDEAPMQADEGAWQSGWLEVRDRPLSWVADALRPYLPGLLLVDDALASKRLSGLFPLDDVQRSLTMLAQGLNLRVQRYSDYCVVLRSPA